MNSFENIIEPEVALSINTMGVKEFMLYIDFISVVKRIRINVNPYITFINSKNEVENIYFSVYAAKLVTEGQFIERGFLNQFKIGELIINGNLRYKLISQGD